MGGGRAAARSPLPARPPDWKGVAPRARAAGARERAPWPRRPRWRVPRPVPHPLSPGEAPRPPARPGLRLPSAAPPGRAGGAGGRRRGVEPSRAGVSPAGQHGRGGGGRLTAPRLSLPDGCGELSGRPACEEESRPSDTPLPRRALLPTRLPRPARPPPRDPAGQSAGGSPPPPPPLLLLLRPPSPPQAGGTRAGAAGDGRPGPVNEQRPEGQCLLNTIKMFLAFIKPVAEKQYFKPRPQVRKGSAGAVYCCWFSTSQKAYEICNTSPALMRVQHRTIMNLHV
ncbi:guanine nucleotide-binding protein G(I)/G(S)/G(T) subunit beta-1 isoform X3 [Falco rusticolus]|uniref:guanine nucleotide-binding protein G(I)/G(S)/G(T) subunit beta-1 isoform X3 n=1 Tax=Falco rusticolus TaxID=120794 RepID=UPI001886A707|nr:guanine nucleotide-binding protein G(I)/G(S)/G(T) subunit beta-1 isoform X3 [Falco rusticolus]